MSLFKSSQFSIGSVQINNSVNFQQVQLEAVLHYSQFSVDLVNHYFTLCTGLCLAETKKGPIVIKNVCLKRLNSCMLDAPLAETVKPTDWEHLFFHSPTDTLMTFKSLLSHHQNSERDVGSGPHVEYSAVKSRHLHFFTLYKTPWSTIKNSLPNHINVHMVSLRSFMQCFGAFKPQPSVLMK